MTLDFRPKYFEGYVSTECKFKFDCWVTENAYKQQQINLCVSRNAHNFGIFELLNGASKDADVISSKLAQMDHLYYNYHWDLQIPNIQPINLITKSNM